MPRSRFNRIVFLLLVTFLVASCQETNKPFKENVTSDKSEQRKTFPNDCSAKYSVTCLKLDIISWVDKLNKDGDLSILPGVTLVKENNTSSKVNTAEFISELARQFPKDPDSRLDAFVLKKISDFINSRSIKLKLLESNEIVDDEEISGAETARAGSGFGGSGFGGGGGGGGGGGKKKGGGGMGTIIAMAAMMKGTMMSLGMGALAALAGKALMTGLISLVLSAIIGLKSLTSGGGKTTYEVIAKPIYTHENTHSVSHEDHHAHGGWGRSYQAPLPIGLRSDYKPA